MNKNFHRYTVRIKVEDIPDCREFGWNMQYQFPEQIVEFLDKLDDWKYIEYHFGILAEDYDVSEGCKDKKVTFEVIEYQLIVTDDVKMWEELRVCYTRTKMMSSYAEAKKNDDHVIVWNNIEFLEAWEELLQ